VTSFVDPREHLNQYKEPKKRDCSLLLYKVTDQSTGRLRVNRKGILALPKFFFTISLLQLFL
jgi:hypothetical protein